MSYIRQLLRLDIIASRDLVAEKEVRIHKEWLFLDNSKDIWMWQKLSNILLFLSRQKDWGNLLHSPGNFGLRKLIIGTLPKFYKLCCAATSQLPYLSFSAGHGVP